MIRPAFRRAGDRLLARLRARADTEHVMYANRVGFCLALGAYFLLTVPDRTAEGVAAILIGLCATAAAFAWLLHGPARSVPRQVTAMAGDMAFMGTLMHLGGAVMGCCYPCILWMVLGNGFRLGRANLLRATAVGTAAFGAVVLTTPFWQDNSALSAGLLLGLALLPLYVMKLLTRLHAARREAQAADKAKSLFLANVSHELRTPLHAIIGMGSLLEKAELPPEPADMARTIMGASRSLLVLIDDVLKLSRMEVDRPAADAAEFSLPDLLLEVRSLVQAQAGEKGLRVALHVGFGAPPRLRGDERHIREVLVNLASNAVKFTEAGGVLIAVRPAPGAPVLGARSLDAPGPRGSDGPRPSADRLRFEVADTGIGIAPEAHGRIFDKFTQAHPGIAERFGGTGLGLAICKQLVDLLGGTIGVESTPGAGSTFWFDVECEAVFPTAAEPAAAGATAPLPGKLTVLSIDAGVRPSLRAAVRALDPDAIITECGGAAVVQAQLAAAARAGRTVVADPSASPAAAEALRAAMAATAGAELPRLLLVGDPAREGARQPDLRWLSPAWVPGEADADGFGAAMVLCEALRPAATRTMPAPQAAPMAAPTPVPAGGSEQDRSAPGRSLTVLVVDDNATNRKVVAKILESGGHRCRLASDGEAALDALEADDVDLALLDVNMPGMSGLEVAKLHKVASLGLRQVPILGLTADASPDMAERCREAGMDGCLTKPIRASELLREVETAVPAAPAQAEPAKVPPVLRVVRSPLFDQHILDGLRDIGGEEFVREVLDGFLEDAGRLASEIGRALEAGNGTAFRAAAHALGSAAANVGAPRISQLSLLMERMRPGEVTAHGRTRLHELAREVAAYAEACPAAGRRSRA